MLREQCDRLRITKEKLQKQLSPPYKVVKFGCTCLEDCEGTFECHAQTSVLDQVSTKAQNEEKSQFMKLVSTLKFSK